MDAKDIKPVKVTLKGLPPIDLYFMDKKDEEAYRDEWAVRDRINAHLRKHFQGGTNPVIVAVLPDGSGGNLDPKDLQVLKEEIAKYRKKKANGARVLVALLGETAAAELLSALEGIGPDCASCDKIGCSGRQAPYQGGEDSARPWPRVAHD